MAFSYVCTSVCCSHLPPYILWCLAPCHAPLPPVCSGIRPEFWQSTSILQCRLNVLCAFPELVSVCWDQQTSAREKTESTWALTFLDLICLCLVAELAVTSPDLTLGSTLSPGLYHFCCQLRTIQNQSSVSEAGSSLCPWVPYTPVSNPNELIYHAKRKLAESFLGLSALIWGK